MDYLKLNPPDILPICRPSNMQYQPPTIIVLFPNLSPLSATSSFLQLFVFLCLQPINSHVISLSPCSLLLNQLSFLTASVPFFKFLQIFFGHLTFY